MPGQLLSGPSLAYSTHQPLGTRKLLVPPPPFARSGLGLPTHPLDIRKPRYPAQPRSGPPPSDWPPDTRTQRRHSNPARSAPPPHPAPGHLGVAGVCPTSVRSAPAHLPSPWTLGSSGANWPSVRSALSHLLSPWTLGPGGAHPSPRQVRLNPPDHPTLLGLAGANCSMGRTCFAWGDNTRSVVRGRAMLCGPATGVVGAPRKTSSPHRAARIVAFPADVAARRRGVPRSRRRRPESLATQPQPRACAKINLIESPQMHSLPRKPDKPGAASRSLWTGEPVVDNQTWAATTYSSIPRSNRHKCPRSTVYRAAPMEREWRSWAVDGQFCCG
ncbi:hypothetical protein LV75_002810 [Actinokineospora diospyrosa]|uniref:Uncharacterized protein n=1 Tax=Actinokineospora diospyrosa TaxID=103728 RepID=A0ABT1ICG2_9PSEU|nr:hypothetical protein [Actinokineospora diospyrosa]